MGKKMARIFLPLHFFAWKLLLLERGTDGALAGISGLSLAAGRFFVFRYLQSLDSQNRPVAKIPRHQNIPDRDIKT